MPWLILSALAAVLLLVAPTRRVLLRHWYVVLPAAAGVVFGLSYAAGAVARGAPRILLLLAPAMAAGILGGAVSGCVGSRSRSTRGDDRE